MGDTAEQLIARCNALHAALFAFHEAFNNRGETTSLQVWSERLKVADKIALGLLGPQEGTNLEGREVDDTAHRLLRSALNNMEKMRECEADEREVADCMALIDAHLAAGQAAGEWKSQLICPRCKVDRLKATCPGPTGNCPMVGTPQGAAPERRQGERRQQSTPMSMLARQRRKADRRARAIADDIPEQKPCNSCKDFEKCKRVNGCFWYGLGTPAGNCGGRGMNGCKKCGAAKAHIYGPTYRKGGWLGEEALVYRCMNCGYSFETPTADRMQADQNPLESPRHG